MDKKVQMFIEQTEKNTQTFSERFNKWKLKQIIKNNTIKKKNLIEYVDRLSNKYNKHLKIIKDMIQEREDKICGVCYDQEANCKLNCIHRLCHKCVKHINKCPFCREEYRQDARYWQIDKEDVIEDIDEILIRNR